METTFHAWGVQRYGGPDVLSPVTRDLPVCGDGQVLIRIRASAVTRADAMIRAGRPRFARPFLGLKGPRAGLLGACFAGDVVAVGQNVRRFAVGDAVFGEAGLNFGANASHICVDAEGSLIAKPEALNYEEAATLFDGALTSWHFLTRVAQLKQGEKVLILGGAGSLGTAAVQFAAALGAQVAATCSARNAALLHSLGADTVIDYHTADPLAQGGNYDVIFDTLGVASFGASKPALAAYGRYVCPVLGLRLLRDTLLSRMAGRKTASFAAAGMLKPEEHRAQMGEVLQLVQQGRFAPVMDRSYPLADLVEAHRYVETGRKRGNVVVV